MEVTELVRYAGEDLLYRQADRLLGIRDDGVDGDREGVLDLAQQVG